MYIYRVQYQETMHLGLVIFPVSVSALFEKPCNADRRRSPSTLTASESSLRTPQSPGGVRMTKAFVLEWHIPVDKPLLEGDTFDRWSEEEVEEGCRFKVDQDGFFISWKSEGREAEVLDLSQVTWPGYPFFTGSHQGLCM